MPRSITSVAKSRRRRTQSPDRVDQQHRRPAASGAVRPRATAAGESREVVAVPASAICEHESRSFVFIDLGDRKYRQKFVSRGIEDQGFVEIASGLSGGEKIVDQGAFVLKSELLLEREE